MLSELSWFIYLFFIFWTALQTAGRTLAVGIHLWQRSTVSFLKKKQKKTVRLLSGTVPRYQEKYVQAETAFAVKVLQAGRNKTTPLSAPSGGRQGTGEIPTMQPIKPKHASHANDVHHFRQRPLDPRINPRPPPCFLSTFSHPSTRSHLILQHFSNLDASVLWGRIWVPVR